MDIDLLLWLTVNQYQLRGDAITLDTSTLKFDTNKEWIT